MKFQFRYDKDDNIDDFTQMEAADEGGNEEVSFRIEAFVAFEKGLESFEKKKM